MRAVMDTPLGHLAIEAENGAVERVVFTDDELLPATEETAQKAVKQLQQYFAGERQVFDVPVRLKGTEFQVAAWEALMKIPYGETVTYQQQAQMMGHPKACRAAGGANNKNHILILVPCHRVVASNGMGGFGCGTEKKRFLLELEKENRNE
ncbi:MAG: methylated-DNA--[Clostridia bacterium]|nr:methylated-DNA--[protein]-cysteine S-methyltransferase [Clostridia bacterium]